MYKVGEYVVHPGQGVCKVEEITDDAAPSYKLMPVGQRNPMLISFPVASEGRLRPILSREEARAIIREYPTMAVEKFTDRSRALEEAKNKKPPVVFQRILKEASERSLREMSVALDMSSEDVAALFESSVAASEN